MKLRYQIIRENITGGLFKYLFKLVDGKSGPTLTDCRVVTTAQSNSPIAPEFLRKRQAQLNTADYLDR